MITELHLSDKPENQYKLNDNQVKVINQLFNEDLSLKKDCPTEIAFFGAFRCGKSFIFQLACFLIAGKYPNLNILYVRSTYNQLMDSVVKQFNNDFGLHGQFIYKITTRQAIFHNGSVINFRAFDKDHNAILSNEYDAAFICQAEDIAEEVFLQILGRMSGSVLPKRLVFTEGNPASTWPKRRYKDAKPETIKEREIFFIEGDTYDNESNLPKGYIDSLLVNYPKSWIDRYVLGGWDQIDEMVFSEYVEKQHLIDPVSYEYVKAFKQRAGLDYGWVNPTAIVWGFVDYDSKLTIFDEWGDSKKTPDEIATQAHRYGKVIIVADYSCKRPDRDGRSVWQDLCNAGLNMMESNKQELANIQLANTLLKTGRLKITKNCVNLIKEIRNYKWKRLKLGVEKNFPEETVDKDNHYIDALLYLIASLEELKTINPKYAKEKDTIKDLVTRLPEYDWSERG